MSRRFRFILHIGTEKTGTTTLQGYLHGAQNELNEHGVAYYASPGRVESRALAASAVGDQAPDDFLKQLSVESPQQRQVFREETERHFHAAMTALDERIHTVVISSEHFHSRLRHPWQVKRLHDLIMPWANDVRVVVYLRPQTDVLSSFYSTALKNGEVRNLEALGRKICHAGNHFYNYQSLLELWAKIFGKKALIPRLFTADELKQGDIVADFAEVIGLSPSHATSANLPRQNESINPVGQALLRGLNRARKREECALTKEEYQPLARRVMNVFSGSGERLPSTVEAELQSLFEVSNRWVCDQFFNEREALFPSAQNQPHKGSFVFSKEQLALVQMVMSRLERSNVNGLPEMDSCACYLRDRAVALESKDIVMARKLMAMAHHIRPHGPFIAKKLEEYEARSGLWNRVVNWLAQRRS
ncbi:hypothetical protein [Marinobacter metalliresistant]|uniref:Sulfotransferase domain-containing protein n=1 Tax=Marinobacter metalliresistant TaxID=2961995 RepID=A0ABZ2W4Q7_9GAMM